MSNGANDDGAGATLPCPACGVAFVLGAQTCDACGIRLVGPDAVALWEVDQELSRLQFRRAALLAALRPGVAPEDVAAAAAVRTSSTSAQPHVQHQWQRPAQPVRPAASGQGLLLLLGVALLFVAAVVFVAVAWRSIGVYGQFAVIVTSVVASGWASVACSARRLSSSAEAFAVLGGGLAVVGLVGAHSLDFVSLGTIAPWTYTGLCGAFLAALAAGVHRAAPSVRTYPLVGLLAGWIAAVTIVGAWEEPRLAAGLVAGWLVLASPLLTWAWGSLEDGSATVSVGRASFPAALRRPVALLSAVLGSLLATYVLAADAFDGEELVVAGLAVVVVLLLLGWSCSAYRPLATLSRDDTVLAALLWVVGGAEVAALLRNAEEPALLVAAAGALAGVVILLVIRSPRTQGWSPQLGLALAGCGVAAPLLVLIDGSHAAAALALALLSLGALALAVAEPSWRPAALLVAVLAALGSLGYALVSLDAEQTRAAAVFAVAGLLLAVATLVRIGCPEEEEGVLAGTTALAFVVSVSLAVDALSADALAPPDVVRLADPLTVVVVVLLAAAAVTIVYSFFRPRGPACAAGALLAISAVWTLLADRDVEVVEAYTLTAALICLTIGGVAHLRMVQPTSWLTLGPATAFALLPSAVVVNETGSAARIVYVLVLGTALLLVGIQTRTQALVAISAAALIIVMLLQLWIAVAAMPRWVSFGAAGLLVVGAAVRYERNARDLRSVGTWFEQMS